jgi:hypothetical protein
MHRGSVPQAVSRRFRKRHVFRPRSFETTGLGNERLPPWVTQAAVGASSVVRLPGLPAADSGLLLPGVELARGDSVERHNSAIWTPGCWASSKTRSFSSAVRWRCFCDLDMGPPSRCDAECSTLDARGWGALMHFGSHLSQSGGGVHRNADRVFRTTTYGRRLGA